MREFDRKIMLRLVNHNPVVAKSYIELCKTMDVDGALGRVFLTMVAGNTLLTRQYESLFDVPPKVHLPDSSLVAEIRAMIKRVGWQNFRSALIEFSQKQSDRMRQCGLIGKVGGWDAVFKKFDGLRKNVQM